MKRARLPTPSLWACMFHVWEAASPTSMANQGNPPQFVLLAGYRLIAKPPAPMVSRGFTLP